MKKGAICLVLVLLSIAVSTYSVPSASAATFVDETVSVSTGSSHSYYGTISKDTTLTIEITVTESIYGGGIDFYIMDTANYNLWNGHLSSTAYVVKSSIVQTSFEWTVPTTQTYYFVLHNGYILPMTVHLKVTYGSLSEASGLLVLVALVALISIVGIVSYLHSKRKTQRTPVRLVSRCSETRENLQILFSFFRGENGLNSKSYPS